jgi:signal transduction histidine kinase
VFVALSAIVLTTPDIGFSSTAGNIVLDTVSLVAIAFGAAVASMRFRGAPSHANLALSAALAVAATAQLLFVTVPVMLDFEPGPSLGSARAVTSLVVAALLMWAAGARSARARLQPTYSLALPWSIAAVTVVVIAAAADQLPVPYAVVGGITTACFAVAALGFGLRALRSPWRMQWWLVLACSASALAPIDAIITGPPSDAWVSLADVLRTVSALAIVTWAASELEHNRGRERVRVIDEERARLARDLHDHVAQELAFIVVQSRRLARTFPDAPALLDIESAAQQALSGSRSTIRGLRAHEAATLGAALKRKAMELARREGLGLTVEVAADIVPSAELEHAVLSVLTEAISNAARHGHATHMEVSLGPRGDELVVRISDDGRGFDPRRARVRSAIGGFGLTGMRERAKEVGADLTLDSEPGRGTTIELAVK